MNSDDGRLELSEDAIYRGIQRIKKNKQRCKVYKQVLMAASCTAMASLLLVMSKAYFIPGSNNLTQSVTCRFQNGDVTSTKTIVFQSSDNLQTNAITECRNAFGLDSPNLSYPTNPKLELGGTVNDAKVKCSKTLDIWIETTKYLEICISR